ncbi:D-glycerate dehydrogenase [Candidatus Bathyarchaeota archaeon]|nr:D-glycerate dehydrogenase [Candidatus Bathyarchaeota archaeon]MBS7630325.1 D-glycerate dehydrogenase [Candidatus Bathyarchaeota archaeon]
MKKYRVFVTRQLFDEAIDIINKEAEVEVFEGTDNPIPRDLLLTKIKDIDGLLCLLTDIIDSEMIEKAKRLKVISNYAVGFNNIDVNEATKRGIYVTNTPGILTETTADFTFALLLAVSRRIAESDRYVRMGNWKYAWGPRMFLGSDVHGKTLGIIGLGRIGKALVKRAKGFDMKVIYYDIVRDESFEKSYGVSFQNLKTLLEEADFVSVNVPLTENTYHLIGEEEISLMKKTAFLINTSRGAVIDEKKLYNALKNKLIAGAALDVFDKEPIDPDNPLLELDNIIVTPHIASASVETRKNMAIIAAKNLVESLKGEEPANLVNPEAKKFRH